ncbi:hypothetical protein NE589_12900, partial [Faecalibacterium prausnitzii]|uniref:hypothetical protein n=1 Tax=Faecalibacterium prausnitzii TaxID=853 RepID=UPI00210EC1C2
SRPAAATNAKYNKFSSIYGQSTSGGHFQSSASKSGAPLFHLKAVILPKYMLSVCAMCTNKRANGCFLVDKSQK